MGSSTAAGAGATSAPWTGSLKAAYLDHGVRVVNLARGGAVTYQGLPISSAPVVNRPSPLAGANIDAAMAFTPKLLLLAYPNNDEVNNYTVEETIRNLAVIRDTATAQGESVMLISAQPRRLSREQNAKLVQVDSELSTIAGSCFVPVREALAAPDGMLAPQYDSGDHIHPNDAGHAVIFNAVKSVIDSGLCVRA